MQISEPTKTGAKTGILATLLAAWNYMSGIDWQWTAIDPDRLGVWLSAVYAFVFYTNKENRKKPSPEQEVPVVTTDRTGEPLGIRLKNPGNLRPLPRGQKWKGQKAIHQTKSGPYLEFETDDYGIRASALNLKNQQRLHNLRTIESIIAKWAPAEDNNDPASYAAFVSRKTGFPVNKVLDLEDDKTAARLLKAIFWFENGKNFYSFDTVLEGAKKA